jgi:peptidoglycan/xylan/chitin deacetylase (PgdA/CDA1 family)
MIHLLRDGTYRVLHSVGLVPALSNLFSGNAVVVMLHEIQISHRAELMTGTPVDLFEDSLAWLRRHGWEFVTLDECLRRLAEGKPQRRCVVLTFDDGYRDLASTALPILEKYNAPFMMYVPTGALVRTLPSWWLGVRQLVRSRDKVVIDAMGRLFRCPDYKSKLTALSQMNQWVHQDYRRAAAFLPQLEKAGISLAALNDVYFLSEREFKALAQHRLASVGGHSVSHPALVTLNDSEARREITENRKHLEHLTGRPVQHFAYPYGRAASFGPRDEQIISELGFDSAASGIKYHLDCSVPNRFALPRISMGGRFGTKASFEASMRGIEPAIVAHAALARFAAIANAGHRTSVGTHIR